MLGRDRVYLDEPYFSGGGHFGPTCRSCKEPILKGHHGTRVEFASDPSGMKGLTGDYHITCAKPFASMAKAINMLSRFGR
jgi:hypothetical protein